MKIFQVTPNPADIVTFNYRDLDYIKSNFYGVLNVSDSECLSFYYSDNGIISLWVPINELEDWTYSPFYAALKMALKKIEKNDIRPILIHCHAGANRSPCVAWAVLIAFYNHFNNEEYKKEADKLCIQNRFTKNILKGNIPNYITRFLRIALENPTYSILGVLQTMYMKENIIR